MIYKDHMGELCSEKYYLQFRDEFIQKCQVIVDDYMKQHGWKNKLSVHSGRRYDKIVNTDVPDNLSDHIQRRVWAFVDKTNGDILKPESWKKPAKHARGNIYEDDCMQFIGPHGPAYMDTIKDYYGT
tara:strand:+ start:198 stop:578 length:381 start_codon:yes stop_codon:yes gene_type:complete